jgi:hypothetical protein
MRQFSANPLGADALGGLAASGTVGILGLIERGLPPAPRAVTRVLDEVTPRSLVDAVGVTATNLEGGSR